MRPNVRLALSAAITPLLVGCAPSRFVDGVGYAAERYGTRDASALRVDGMPHLRFDIASRSDLDDAIALRDLPDIKARGGRIIKAAHVRAIESAGGEMDRMSPDGLGFLIETYHLGFAAAAPAKQRELLRREFAERTRPAVAADLEALAAAPDARKARALLQRVRRKVEPPIADQGKLGRVLLSAPLFVPATIGAEMAEAEAMQRDVVADFEHVTEYHPVGDNPAASAAELESGDEEALVRAYAPILVQQIDPAAKYSADEDRIGRVYLTGTRDGIEVNVGVDDPVIYWATRKARIGPREYDQLVYVAWYPSRPALKAGDALAGRIDGVVIRITLDRRKRPAVYEFVRSCGCFHTLWVAEFVEAAAREQFGTPAEDRAHAIERDRSGRRMFLPALVPDDGARPRRPIALVSAGHHLLMGVRPAEEGSHQGKVEATHTYRLEEYEALTRLPLGDGVASMFGSDGLVHNAGRREGWLLAPTGMLSAGQPRQLGTMKILMDAYDYDDPRLLERHLRFPDGF